MWNPRYWAPRYWAGRYFAPFGAPAVPGAYWSPYNARVYWTGSYWSRQGDSNPFTSTVTTGLAVASTISTGSASVSATNAATVSVTSGLTANASLGIDATVQNIFADEFIAAAPLQLPTVAASCTFSATVVVSVAASSGTGFYWPGRYFASHYWAPRYWQTQTEFTVTATSGLSTSTACTIAAGLDMPVVIPTTAGLAVDVHPAVAFSGIDSASPVALRGADGATSRKRRAVRFYTEDDDEADKPAAEAVASVPLSVGDLFPPPLVIEPEEDFEEEEQAAMRAAEMLLLGD